MLGVAFFLQSKDFASFIAAIGDRQKWGRYQELERHGQTPAKLRHSVM